ncbi:DUF2798 domain-containing protein [Marinobacter sp. F3R11]|uniref:DUF2798 domain-containing protein n=1 Tax=Marinobacter sp. F3R11 TaxID=2267231 RepID=UPI000DE804FD|nr:DUF2798 domain-containing protein [Marinobacter sp. F3R11]RBW50652.1 DUF2798 domain-containing protein [Marinobacter sp. F3R11]
MSRIKPARVRQFVFGFYMSGMMSLLMSGVITLVSTGFDSEFFSRWMAAFLVAWAVAFPLITFIAPIAVKLTEMTVGRLDKEDKPTPTN